MPNTVYTHLNGPKPGKPTLIPVHLCISRAGNIKIAQNIKRAKPQDSTETDYYHSSRGVQEDVGGTIPIRRCCQSKRLQGNIEGTTSSGIGYNEG